jgi:hypothetical protein
MIFIIFLSLWQVHDEWVHASSFLQNFIHNANARQYCIWQENISLEQGLD